VCGLTKGDVENKTMTLFVVREEVVGGGVGGVACP
jgi:hypothetical protein